MLARDAADGGIEILLVQRAKQLRFMGGMYVFPGGAVHAEDGDPAIEPRLVSDAIAWGRAEGEAESALPPEYGGDRILPASASRERELAGGEEERGDGDGDAHAHALVHGDAHEHVDEHVDAGNDRQPGAARIVVDGRDDRQPGAARIAVDGGDDRQPGAPRNSADGGAGDDRQLGAARNAEGGGGAGMGGAEGGNKEAAVARAYALAGIRETCEEAGILVGVRDAGAEQAALARRVLLEGSSLARALEAIDASLDLSSLVPLARWITPAVSPIRFDTRFYVARAPANQDASADGTESSSILWRSPSRAIAEHRARTIVLSPPTLSTLADIAELSSVKQLLEFAASRRAPCVEP